MINDSSKTHQAGSFKLVRDNSHPASHGVRNYSQLKYKTTQTAQNSRNFQRAQDVIKVRNLFHTIGTPASPTTAELQTLSGEG